MKLKFKDFEVSVTGLYQWMTYSGMMEGSPGEKMNEMILDSIHNKAYKYTHVKSYYIVPPKLIKYAPKSKSASSPQFKMPDIACAMKCYYKKTSSSKIIGNSNLTLICFQNNFGTPFDEEILTHLEQVDWFAHSEDYDWESF